MSIRRVSRSRSKTLLAEFFEEIESRLSGNSFLFGTEPTLADFSAYHVVWFGGMINSLSFLNSLPGAKAWYHRMLGFGHGNRKNVSRKEVFAAARESKPRPLEESTATSSMLGSAVQIGPNDYAQDTVTGVLVHASASRFVLLRETDKFGALHVHFPVQGYSIQQVA